MSRRSIWILSALLLLVVGLAGYWYVRHSWLHVQTAFAEEQTLMFEECREKASQCSRPEDITAFIRQTLVYYPSGSKQRTGSHLDGIVERTRRLAVADMIGRLRLTTGLDLGNDPQAWMDRFLENESRPVHTEKHRNSLAGGSNTQGEVLPGELLRYQQAGAFSLYRGLETVIRIDGSVSVSLTNNLGMRARQLQLSADELSALEHLIDGVNLFGQSPVEPTSDFPIGSGHFKAQLSVTKGTNALTLDLTAYHLGRFFPLLDQLRRLNHLAEVLDGLETRRDQWSAFAASEASSSTGPNAVLQARALIEPLKQIVLDSQGLSPTNIGKLQIALPALARLQTEAEWIGFISRTLREPPVERQNLLLHVLTSQPFWSQPMPEGRVEALFPVFLAILREPENLGPLSSDRSEALSAVCSFLNLKQCRAARSTLVNLRENGQDWKLTNSADVSWLSLPNSASALNKEGRRIDQWRDPFE
jgi:hypothetical protein